MVIAAKGVTLSELDNLIAKAGSEDDLMATFSHVVRSGGLVDDDGRPVGNQGVVLAKLIGDACREKPEHRRIGPPLGPLHFGEKRQTRRERAADKMQDAIHGIERSR